MAIPSNLALLIKTCKRRLRRAIRRADSLQTKMEDLFNRSPDVRRYVAYQQTDVRNTADVYAYQADLSHWVLKSDGE